MVASRFFLCKVLLLAAVLKMVVLQKLARGGLDGAFKETFLESLRLRGVALYNENNANLSKIFPSQYMLDLYQDLSTSAQSFNMITSFTDKSLSSRFLYFDISAIREASKSIVKVELHIYTKRVLTVRNENSIEIVLKPVGSKEWRGRYIKEKVNTKFEGWKVLNVEKMISEWFLGEKLVKGFIKIRVMDMNGRFLQNDAFLNLGKKFNLSYLPKLVIFTQTDNEVKEDSSQDSISPLIAAELSSHLNLEEYERVNRRLKRSNQRCSLTSMYVDFKELGWSNWIISPKGYYANFCSGQCRFPLGQDSNPTNHATIQSIVYALGLSEGISAPCCVPKTVYPISILYFDDYENVVLRKYNDMIATSCGCH